MLISTIILSTLALILLIIGYLLGEGQHIQGMKLAYTNFINVLPLLLLAFLVSGMAQALLPKEHIRVWIGNASGIRGILIGTLVGGITPGGPFVNLPIVAGFLNAGAGVGMMVAYLTSWSLWATGRLPLEIGILGWKFTLIRLASTFFFPPIAGLIAHVFFGRI